MSKVFSAHAFDLTTSVADYIACLADNPR